MKNDLRGLVEKMIAELMIKIEEQVPDEGDFPMVYSEFKVHSSELCLTDIMLKFRSIPDYLPDYKTRRWLEVVGYRLPIPYKTTILVHRGNKNSVLDYLCTQEAAEKILGLIPRLDDCMRDY